MLVKFRNHNAPAFWSNLDNFFAKDFNPFFETPASKTVPAVNVKETDAAYHLEMAAPGMKKEDFIIKLENDLLEISSEKKSEQTERAEKFTRKEYHFSSFKRSFSIPETVDANEIKASYVDGILTLELPKKAETKKPEAKEIKVS